MKNADIRALTLEELQAEEKKAARDLEDLRFEYASFEDLEDKFVIRRQRKHYARIKTELRARTLKQLADMVEDGSLNSMNKRELVHKQDFITPVKLKTLKKIIKSN